MLVCFSFLGSGKKKLPYPRRGEFVHGADGQFTTCDEVLCLLHHYAHFFQLVETKFGETSGSYDEACRFHSDAWHTENHFIIRLVDVYGKVLRVTECPTQLRVNFEVEVRVGIIYNLVHFELIETHEPVGLI